jgi:hypothetical protein
MTKNLGPWTTAASAGSKAHLSTFWKRRLAMIPAAHRSSTRLGGRVILLLLITAGLVWVLPTLRGATAQAQQDRPRSAASDAKPKEANSRRETYKVNQADAESVAEVVRNAYRETKGIAISVDKQRSSILVVGPTEVHELVRKLIDSAAAAPSRRVTLVLLRKPLVSPEGIDLKIEKGMKADEWAQRMRLRQPIDRSRSRIAPIPNEWRRWSTE